MTKPDKSRSEHLSAEFADMFLQPATAHSQQVREVFNSIPTAVAALCAVVDGEPRGIVATSLAVGVSYDPPMVSFSAQTSSTTWPYLRRAGRIGLSILSDEQIDECRQIASKAGSRFADLETMPTERGGLLVKRAAAWLECSISAVVAAGDHEVVLLQVEGVDMRPGSEPLIHHRAGFRNLAAMADV
ncbi:flavin reductase family protein [Cellulomonas sp. S1-8]|uniref:flavin reductase family protein n=1 Tax=Cellulomonas sp. S1-8 TaxID=2904790 RepID=UPI002243D600|nr:flavin reductase family protein [Cellulomonas sp. S1-8]UZN04161.1 flavin reductase family protein [Cellulomonas sp. S1-8]